MNVTIRCKCGYEKEITEPEDGQTLGGTAGWYAAKHKHKNANITFQYGEPTDIEQEMKDMTL